jgi:hypothetical protein
MSIISRRVRAALVTSAMAGAGLSGVLGTGVAHASSGHPNGFVVITSCTGVSGTIHINPGLHAVKARTVQEVLSSNLSGCSDIFSGPMPGSGTFTAIVSGSATYKAQNLSGTFTIIWPAASGDNPSNGTLSETESNGVESVSGTVTSGFETGAEFALQYAITGHTGKPTSTRGVIAETLVNTKALTLSENTG